MRRDPADLIRIETPELEECEAFFVFPTLTWAEGSVVLKHLDAAGEFDMDGAPDLVLKLAKTEAGKRMWSEAHREKILQWDFVAMIRILEQLAPVFEGVAAAVSKKG